MSRRRNRTPGKSVSAYDPYILWALITLRRVEIDNQVKPG